LMALLVTGTASAVLNAQQPPSPVELDAVATRGRMLADYDAAARSATDAVLALERSRGIKHYIVTRSSLGLRVSFGQLNGHGDTFLVGYVAEQRSDQSAFEVSIHDPPLADTGYLLRASRAVDIARSRFQGEQRPYNVAVLPAPAGEWWVYVYPAQSEEGVWPLGADARYRVSMDGRQIREQRILHRRIIEYRPLPPGQAAVAMTHTAVMDEIPEDTDVLLVLRRNPAVPEIVVTKSFAYRIEIDGSIAYLGRKTDLMRSRRP